MVNPELGTHHDKLCADILTGNTPNTPLSKLANYLGYFLEKALITCPWSVSSSSTSFFRLRAQTMRGFFFSFHLIMN